MLPPPGQTSYDTLLARAGAVTLAAALVWALVVLAAVAVEAATRGRVRAALALGCPPRAHRRLLAVATAVLATSLVAPAAHGEDLDGLPLPDRTTGEVVASRDRPAPRVSAVVTVRPGQSLWAISRDRLPVRATPARIAALTHRLHRLNRRVIGPDPDLIHPGQQLAVPARTSDSDREDS